MTIHRTLSTPFQWLPAGPFAGAALLTLLALGTSPAAKAQDILFQLDGQAGDRMGRLAGCGDLNGDGVADILCGAPDANGGKGRVQLVSGATGLPIWSRAGQSDGGQLGAALAAIADIDGDGHADVAAGAPGADRVLLLSGVNGALLRTLTGAAGSQFGQAVSGAGDLDADGRGDVLVGAPLDDAAGTDSGSAFALSGATGSLLGVLHGSLPGDLLGGDLAGPQVGTQVSEYEPTDIISATQGGNGGAGYVRILSAGNFQLLGTIAGAAPGDGFGASVAQAGDLDGDGTGDLLVGADGAGRVTAISGASLATLLELESPLPGVAFGARVAGLGDVNGDGVPDIGVGSPLASGTAGRLWVHSGSDGSQLLSLLGSAAGNRMGGGLAAIGDLDHDGRWDLAVAEPRAGADAGHVTVLALSIWNTLEDGLPGIDGVPRLSGEGGLVSSQSAHLELQSGRPITAATLLVGLAMQFDPPAGVYVPTPDIVVAGLQTSEIGTISYDFDLPTALPAGAVVYQQFLLVDPAAPNGLSRSNIVAATVP